MIGYLPIYQGPQLFSPMTRVVALVNFLVGSFYTLEVIQYSYSLCIVICVLYPLACKLNHTGPMSSDGSDWAAKAQELKMKKEAACMFSTLLNQIHFLIIFLIFSLDFP